MKVPNWERLVHLAGSVASILAFGGAVIVAAIVGAILKIASTLPQPWLTFLAIGVFLVAFGALSALAQWWRASHPSSSLSRWLFASALPTGGAKPTADASSPPALEQQSLTTNLALLSGTQKRVLRAIEDATTERSLVAQQKLQSLVAIPPKELFYRLEQLRLFGLVERADLGPTSIGPEYGYRFTEGYARHLGRDLHAAAAPRSSPTQGS